MPTRSPFSVRTLLVHLAGNFNLVLGGLAIAFGAYVLLAGADALATMMQAGDAGAQAVGQVAPAGDAKKIGDVMELAGKGLGAVFLAMASIVAGCAIAQGLPLVCVGLGILFRQRWARAFGILFGLFGLLQGLACLGGSGGTRGVLVSGVVFTVYGLLSLVALIAGGSYFARPDPDFADDDEVAPARHNGPVFAGILVSGLIVASACGIAFLNLPRTQGRPPAGVADKQTQKLIGIWENSGPDPHRLAFARNGILYFGTDKGSSRGTYKLASADTLDLEYELPEAIFQAQKAAFDIAKKAADNPDNPFKGMIGAIEPVRVIKDRVHFTLADGDRSLTLHGAKKPVQYRQVESLPEDSRIEALFAFVDFKEKDKKVESDKKNQGKPDDKPKVEPKVEPKNEGTDLYRKRQAELHDVIAKGQVSRLKEVVKNGVGLNDRDDKGETALMKAVQAGYIDVVKELISMGADWTVADPEGKDMFYYAVSIGRFEWLITSYPQGQDRALLIKNTYFYWTGHVNQGKTVKKLNGFMVAAAHGQLGDLKFMCEYQDEVNRRHGLSVKDNDGKTALDHAQAKGHKEIVAYIESVTGTKATVTPKDKKNTNWTASTKPEEIAFLKACEAGDLDTVDATLKAVRAPNDQVAAVKCKDLLQARDAKGRTPLMLVAGRGDATLVLVLAKHVRELSPFGSLNTFKILEAADGEGQTAFHHAAAHGDAEVIDHLFVALIQAWGRYAEQKVNWFRVLQHQDNAGKTALERAEAKGHKTVVQKIKAHCDDNFQNGTTTTWSGVYRSVLEITCYEGDVATVRQLVQAGCPLLRPKYDYFASTDNTRTPLMYAAGQGNVAVVKVLLDSFGDDTAKKQAYMDIRLKEVGTALSIANSANQPEVAALLRKHGAK